MDGRYWNGMKSLDKAYTPIPFDAVSEYLGVFWRLWEKFSDNALGDSWFFATHKLGYTIHIG
jgi:hypothetical protein